MGGLARPNQVLLLRIPFSNCVTCLAVEFTKQFSQFMLLHIFAVLVQQNSMQSVAAVYFFFVNSLTLFFYILVFCVVLILFICMAVR